jgi:hypothetical protein
LTFDLAVTPVRLQRCCHSLKVTAKSIGEVMELGHAALFGGGGGGCDGNEDRRRG